MKTTATHFRERAVALIITLILLSVITFLTVTFLVLSQHAKEQVTTTTQQLNAQLAAQQALEQAEARIAASMITTTNGYNFGLLVSTNYQSPFFDTTQAAGTINVANVNYLNSLGQPVTGAGYLQMLNNQLVLPRPPVFVFTNSTVGAPPDFRFYLDLNRNGIDDPSVAVPEVDQFGNTNFFPVAGDPEWIGVLQHPDRPHSRSNLYVARYVFLAQPIGNSLDINYIHNQTRQELSGPNFPQSDGFLRNQGVGTWEINLAAFLHGLNPNYWDYSYTPTNSAGLVIDTPSGGQAFQDANNILQFRYDGNFNTLAPFYPFGDGLINGSSPIDIYSAGQLMTGFTTPAPLLQALTPTAPWSGSDNTNHLFSAQDFFIPKNTPSFPLNILANFSNNMASAGVSIVGPGNLPLTNGNANFNRYTYYRMLAQLGMESAPETNKLHVNFDNLDALAGGTVSPTNFISWPAVEFFTNAADRLLASHTNFIVNVNGFVTNLSTEFIPIYPTNYYTPAVHRMLQLAANIYDATTNKNDGVNSDFDYPSVFRPTFGRADILGQDTIYIAGYVEVGPTNSATVPDFNLATYALPDQLSTVEQSSILPLNGIVANINLFGAPWVIGAKKGFPNFNQIDLQSSTQISRKLQIVKDSIGSTDTSKWVTNTQYVVGLSNTVGIQAWNSYIQSYTRPTLIAGTDFGALVVTNEKGQFANFTWANGMGAGGAGFLITNWPGFPGWGKANWRLSFIPTMLVTSNWVPGSVYSTNANGIGSFTANTTFTRTPGYPLPLLGLLQTNRMRFIMLDTKSGRVIDYVQLDGMNSRRDLSGELMNFPGTGDYGGKSGVWDTNRVNNAGLMDPLLGVMNQIEASKVGPTYANANYNSQLTSQDWTTSAYPPPGFSSVTAAVTNFNQFLNGSGAGNANLSIQVPYTPTRTVSVAFSWQCNDPLVHYMLSDLAGVGSNSIPATNFNYTFTNLVLGSVTNISKNYRPWILPQTGQPDQFTYDLSIKDPQITRSDDWQFPNGKFPNIGWLGRVHRGTPWQTVYLKSAPVSLLEWVQWTGNSNYVPGSPFMPDAVTSLPTNDWALFDIFTTAPNDNATRGQLSINQTNFAAWAAVLGGVVAITNFSASGTWGPLIIDPNVSANGPAIAQIVGGLMSARANFPGQTFTQLGQVLSVPQLTVASPFLDQSTGAANDPTLTDEAYERLPQQIMSLLRVGSPRYVIYAYGQSLKPAESSLQVGGPYYGTCTNYEITGEFETRTVVRFEPSTAMPQAGSNSPAVNLMMKVLNPTKNPVSPYFSPANQPPMRAVIENFNVLPPE